MSELLNEGNFQEKTSQGVVLVDFFSEHCGPCRMLAPVLETLQNAAVYKVDVYECLNIAGQYGVSAVPTLVFLKNGQEVHRMVGLQSASVLQNKINELAQ